jgi:Tol biopolymer transport system component
MNIETPFDRIVADALRTAAPASAPEGLVADVLEQARRTGRRPRWLAVITERPMLRPPVVLVGSPTARMASILVALVLAAVVGTFALFAGGLTPRFSAVVPPSPTGIPTQATGPVATASPAPSRTQPAQEAARLVAYNVAVKRDPCAAHLTAMCTDSQLWMANTDGSGAHLLLGAKGESVDMLGWSADGSRLLVGSSSGLVITDTNGIAQQTIGSEVTCPHPPKEKVTLTLDFCTSADGFSWSPDGTRIAFVRGYANLDRMTILAILDVATGTVTELRATKTTNGSEQCWATRNCQGMNDTPRWSPDGRSLVFARQVMSPEPGSPWTSAAIFTIGADGTGMRRVTPAGMVAFDPNWSPDGTTIAFPNTQMLVTSDRTSVTDMLYDVYTIGLDGAGMRRLTDDGGSAGPRWTATGRLTFVRADWNWVMDRDGSNATRLDFDLAQLTAAGCVVCRFPAADAQVGSAWWQPLPGG